MLNYEQYTVGQLKTNCYLLWEEETKDCLVIDPGDDGLTLAELINQKQLKPVGILATHGHFDHVMGALDLKLMFNIPFYCNSKDQFLLDRMKETASYYLKTGVATPNFKKIDIDLNLINKLTLGKEEIAVIQTPGHTPGGVCFYCPKEGYVFSGDTLFLEGGGSVDHKYSSSADLSRSMSLIKSIPGKIILLPGH